ncbi:MAG: SRPBCC family protein [Syntrophaceae bacterium]|nr:SRPBCC family protein [Syntrophaceae bacterium]
MFSFSDSVVINAPAERVYKILIDFKNYRQINPPELKKIKIISMTDNRAKVNFLVGNSLISTDYTLDYKLIPNKLLEWRLIDGAIIIKNSGKWELTSLDKKATKAAFKFRVDCSFFVPSSVALGPFEKGAPKTLAKVKKMAEEG